MVKKNTGKPAWELVADLAEAGKTCGEISEELKIGDTAVVRRLAYYARRQGRKFKLHKPVESTFIHNAMRGRSTGGVGLVLRGLPREVIVWVTDQIPEGGTLADIVRGIILDAHDEEVTSTAKRG